MDSGTAETAVPETLGPQDEDVPEGAEDVPETTADTPQDVLGTEINESVPEPPSAYKNEFWHVPESPNEDVPEGAEDVPEMAQGWRVEVTNAGIYWQWRKGSHANRQARKGGKFSTLSKERQAQYEHNKREHHDRKHKAKGRGA